ncbi:MAG: hypothetical protein ACJAWW_000189, partial [Sulfurimonas sp.]
DIIKDYALAMESFNEFLTIANAIREVESYIKSLENISKTSGFMSSITSLIDDLKYWRNALIEQKNVDDIHFMDSRIIEDTLAITKTSLSL